MKRSLIIALAAMLILVTAASAAPAASSPTADAYVRSTQTSTNYGSDIFLSLYANGTGCNTQDYFYLKFDLSSVTQSIGRATLTLTTAALPSSVEAGTKVSLYQVTDDSWTEGGITYANAPAVGAELTPAVDAPTANGQAIVFGSASEASALSNYLETQAQGDNVASLAVKLTGVCSPVTTGVRFASKENSTVGSRPSLQLYTPNAITLSTFDTAQPAINWPLFIGLGMLGLAVVGAVAYRRRAAS